VMIDGGSSVGRAATAYGTYEYDSNLYDVDPATGFASNPVKLFVVDRPDLVPYVSSLSFDSNGDLWAAAFLFHGRFFHRIVSVDPSTGALTPLAIDLDMFPGSLGYIPVTPMSLSIDPKTGLFYFGYGTNSTLPGSSLVSIDPVNLQETLLATYPNRMYDLAFDNDGTLWALGEGNKSLWKIDPTTGAILDSFAVRTQFPVGPPIDGIPFFSDMFIGMDKGPGNTLLIVTGEWNVNAYWSLDTTTETMTYIGLSNLSTGLSNIAYIPEVSPLYLTLLAAIVFVVPTIRRASQPGAMPRQAG